MLLAMAWKGAAMSARGATQQIHLLIPWQNLFKIKPRNLRRLREMAAYSLNRIGTIGVVAFLHHLRHPTLSNVETASSNSALFAKPPLTSVDIHIKVKV